MYYAIPIICLSKKPFLAKNVILPGFIVRRECNLADYICLQYPCFLVILLITVSVISSCFGVHVSFWDTFNKPTFIGIH